MRDENLPELPEFMTVPELADLCRVLPPTIYRWIRFHGLVAYRPTGGKYIIPLDQPFLLQLNWDNKEGE